MSKATFSPSEKLRTAYKFFANKSCFVGRNAIIAMHSARCSLLLEKAKRDGIVYFKWEYDDIPLSDMLDVEAFFSRSQYERYLQQDHEVFYCSM